MKKKQYPFSIFRRCLSMKGNIAACLLILLPLWIFGQANRNGSDQISPPAGFSEHDFVTIENIYVEGNRRTRTDIIQRELDFKAGDTISMNTLSKRIEQNEYNLMNTGLFLTASIVFKEWEGTTNKVGLAITVKESWYIFPFPIVELADRNFNVWWETYNHSLSRLNLGVRFYHNNFTGRRDVLKAVGQVGFTKKFEVIYTLPYFNKKRTLGINFNFLATREKEIGYTTLDNKLLFNLGTEKFLLRRFRGGFGALLRRGLGIYHRWDLTLHHNLIDERVRDELNPDFFLHGLAQRYFALNYEFVYDKRDIRPYPMRGFLLSGTINKQGLGVYNDVDAMSVGATVKHYLPISQRWSTEFIAKGKAGLIREKQPYYNSAALGYEPDYLRGYEFYVIDGLDYVYQKSGLRFELFNGGINWGNHMFIEALRLMPVKVYLKTHFETGYVNNPFYKTNNPLSNELLYSNSIGFDLIIYYNKVFNFEVSRNHLNEYGFFLHWAFSF